MKLYLINGSPNGRKVLSVVNHLGLMPKLIWLDIFNGDTQHPDFLKLSPSGLAPVLVDDDIVLWESNAINIYLCSKVKDQTLYPIDVRGQADVQRWLCWELAHYNKALGNISFQTVAKPQFGLGETDQHLVNVYLDQFNKFAAVLEQHLNGRSYIVGNDWTLADYALGHIQMFVEAVPIDWDQFPNLVRFYRKMASNPYWLESAAMSPNEIGRIPDTI